MKLFDRFFADVSVVRSDAGLVEINLTFYGRELDENLIWTFVQDAIREKLNRELSTK